MKNTKILITIIAIIGVLVVFFIIASDNGSEPYIPATYETDEPKVYNAANLYQSDMENIAESYINGNGKYYIEMWYNNYTVKNIRITSYDEYRHETSEDGKMTAYITAHGTFSIYNKYGEFEKSHTFDYGISVKGTFTSSYIKDIAQHAQREYLRIDGSRTP